MKKRATKKNVKRKPGKRTARTRTLERPAKHEVLESIAKIHHTKTQTEIKLYRFGFWLFFLLILASVGFSIWAISSIYLNYQVVTQILDESFDRTNLVLDITSSKITTCDQQLKECQSIVGSPEVSGAAVADTGPS
jgi:hypothetical protein